MSWSARELKKHTCPKCRHYAPIPKFAVPDDPIAEITVCKTDYFVNHYITSIVKEGPGTCSIRTQNEELHNVQFWLVPNCRLGFEGLRRGRCSNFEPKAEGLTSMKTALNSEIPEREESLLEIQFP